MRESAAVGLAIEADILPVLQVKEVKSDRRKELLFVVDTSIVTKIEQETGVELGA